MLCFILILFLFLGHDRLRPANLLNPNVLWPIPEGLEVALEIPNLLRVSGVACIIIL